MKEHILGLVTTTNKTISGDLSKEEHIQKELAKLAENIKEAKKSGYSIWNNGLSKDQKDELKSIDKTLVKAKKNLKASIDLIKNADSGISSSFKIPSKPGNSNDSEFREILDIGLKTWTNKINLNKREFELLSKIEISKSDFEAKQSNGEQLHIEKCLTTSLAYLEIAIKISNERLKCSKGAPVTPAAKIARDISDLYIKVYGKKISYNPSHSKNLDYNESEYDKDFTNLLSRIENLVNETEIGDVTNHNLVAILKKNKDR